MKRGLNLVTLQSRYRALRRDARIMAAMLELAAQSFAQIARRAEPGVVIASSINAEYTYTASDIRDLASECSRIAYQCGRGKRARKP